MIIKESLLSYVKKTYHTDPDHPFSKYPSCQTIRHSDTRKWFGLFMDVKREKLGLSGNPDEYVDILNLKCDPDMAMMLQGQSGILPSYHMKAGNWITVLLDGSISVEQILPLIDLSYELTSAKSGAKKGKPHNPYWIVPANPRYYDIEQAIRDGSSTFFWKQGSSILPGDTVYLYVAAPISAIRYECRVLETNLPYSYDDPNIHIKKVMNLQLLNTFEKDVFSLNALKKHGVTTVRGPRSVPASLLHELKQYTK